MSDERHPLLEASTDEEPLSFSSGVEEQACIGHLRGDFGCGTEFWTTWWDHQEALKDQTFKDELDEVVNALRKDGPLKDLGSMERFCRDHPKARMSPKAGAYYYGFRVDTTKHRYYLRFLPRQKNYNFYIYCYKTDKLERVADLPPREENMSDKTIKVLMVEPMKPCEVREIPHDLKSLQGIVGGGIEMTYPFTDPAAIICNAESKNLDLPPNRLLCDRHGTPYILCGTFLIAGIGGEDLVSLTVDQLHRYKSMFDSHRLYAIPLKTPDSQEKRPEHNKKKRGESHER